jgi:hypothetical protein
MVRRYRDRLRFSADENAPHLMLPRRLDLSEPRIAQVLLLRLRRFLAIVAALSFLCRGGYTPRGAAARALALEFSNLMRRGKEP